MSKHMEPAQIAKRLRDYNAWRRGNESIEQPRPASIGEAIDAAIAIIEKQADALAKAREALVAHIVGTSGRTQKAHEAILSIDALRHPEGEKGDAQ